MRDFDCSSIHHIAPFEYIDGHSQTKQYDTLQYSHADLPTNIGEDRECTDKYTYIKPALFFWKKVSHKNQTKYPTYCCQCLNLRQNFSPAKSTKKLKNFKSYIQRNISRDLQCTWIPIPILLKQSMQPFHSIQATINALKNFKDSAKVSIANFLEIWR